MLKIPPVIQMFHGRGSPGYLATSAFTVHRPLPLKGRKLAPPQFFSLVTITFMILSSSVEVQI